MMKRRYRLWILFGLLLPLLACSGNEAPEDFQQNQPSGYVLTDITEGYGSVDDAYNSIDTRDFNDRLAWAVDASAQEFELSSYSFADILADPNAPLAELVRSDLGNLLSRFIDPQPRHYEKVGVSAFYQSDAETLNQNLYAFLDKLSDQEIDVPEDYLSGLANKVIAYIISSIPVTGAGHLDKTWLNTEVSELVEDLIDPDFQEDFIDITEFINKICIQADYPMWVDDSGTPLNYADIDPATHTNIDLGNAVKGSRDLITWLNLIIRNPETRLMLYDAIQNLANILDPVPQSELALKLRQLVVNIEDHFTVGGEVYEANPIYSENNDLTYSDAEIGQTLREFLPLIQQLLMRSDRPNAIISDKEGAPPVYPLDLTLANLRGIGFDPDLIDVERSIYDLLRYDVWGRDRLNDTEAWATPYLESLLFLTHATSHHGWRDGGTTTEINASSDSRSEHGHGTYVEDLTLNDSLFSIHMLKTLNYLGVYELSLKPEDGNHIYRTKTPFTLSQVDELHTGNVTGDDLDYRFFYDGNYGVLQFLIGPGPGDLGAPNGGNPNGESLGANQYLAYAPNGLHETQLSAWTMGWGVRACFNGEGPYYYADPNAEIVILDGTTYHKYLRPGGMVYALVSSDGSHYLYPTEEGDTEDTDTALLNYNGRRERANRYKSQWRSDYYVGHFSAVIGGGHHYFTLDNSSGDTQIVEISDDPGNAAGSLVYNESIAEVDPMRACASPEEAFFRNYQWVMNEKKMVLVIPLYMNAFDSIKGMVFQILECHGWSGLANVRKYRGNRVWAKKGDTGLSTIPGDYRIEVAAAADGLSSMFISDNAVYNDNVDCGNATPAIVGHNLQALYRLGFPRSPEIDRGNNITDRILGSQDFAVGDETWNNRNAFMPILFSVLAGLRDYTPAYNPDQKPGINAGMRTFLTHIPMLIKPLFYYSREDAAAGAVDTWVPRVYGTQSYGDFQGKPFLQSTADIYDGTPDTWFGSWEERRHFQPAEMKTMLNVLIDSDLTNPQSRCDGLLPLITETRAMSHLLKLLLHPSTPTLPLEQWMSALKYTRGNLTIINASPESGKNVIYPSWMFAEGVEASRDTYGAFTEYTGVRDEDTVMDDFLDSIVGRDAIDSTNDGYGLANYPDDKPDDADWEDFDDTVDTIADLLHESSPHSVTTNLLSLLDRIFAGDQLYANEEIGGLLYGIGKISGYFEAGLDRWVYQGEDGFNDIYNMMALRLPQMDSVVTQNEVIDPAAAGGSPGFYGYGDHYYAQLVLLSNLADSDGLLEFLLNTISVEQDWETILSDLDRFMRGQDIADPQSPLWPTLAELLRDLGSAVADTQNSDCLDGIMEEYGFQFN